MRCRIAAEKMYRMWKISRKRRKLLNNNTRFYRGGKKRHSRVCKESLKAGAHGIGLERTKKGNSPTGG